MWESLIYGKWGSNVTGCTCVKDLSDGFLKDGFVGETGTQGDDTIVGGRGGSWSRKVTTMLQDIAEKHVRTSMAVLSGCQAQSQDCGEKGNQF